MWPSASLAALLSFLGLAGARATSRHGVDLFWSLLVVACCFVTVATAGQMHAQEVQILLGTETHAKVFHSRVLAATCASMLL